MKIVITYQHRGNDDYLPLIDMAFASAKRMGYETLLVGNIKAGDTQIPFPADREPMLMNWVLAAQLEFIKSNLFYENSVIFSPDALIVRPLEEVFSQPFDVAFTDRRNSRWPINNGVIYLKPQRQQAIAELWKDALSVCRAYPEETQEWFGDQQALQDIYVAGNHHAHGVDVALLPCDRYNASPRNDDEIDVKLLETAYIIHLKGKRKPMMKSYWDAICSEYTKLTVTGGR